MVAQKRTLSICIMLIKIERNNMMLKRKMIFIVAVVLVMMLAMTITAFATFQNCYLHPNNSGSVSTTPLSATNFHCSGYNSMDSTAKMSLKLRMDGPNGWDTIYNTSVPIGEYRASTTTSVNPLVLDFMTRISSLGSNGGVEGVGCCFDY